ncbi:hypothetical protein QBC36DRAFT_308468 [Triangularia setosa]|uniref:Uncharacterized protein n=1 Tax=Triangularia setosa TaxID=2587417 RepID=A0AAN6WCT8_9PEZI|nr:hypothetical protein QBC36DRAFT_308468 [Podospora setosa]
MAPTAPYRPCNLHLGFLLSLVLVTTVSLGLIEYSLHKLPSISDLSNAIVVDSDYNPISATTSMFLSVTRKTAVTRTTIHYINTIVRITDAKATGGMTQGEDNCTPHIATEIHGTIQPSQVLLHVLTTRHPDIETKTTLEFQTIFYTESYSKTKLALNSDIFFNTVKDLSPDIELSTTERIFTKAMLSIQTVPNPEIATTQTTDSSTSFHPTTEVELYSTKGMSTEVLFSIGMVPNPEVAPTQMTGSSTTSHNTKTKNAYGDKPLGSWPPVQLHYSTSLERWPPSGTPWVSAKQEIISTNVLHNLTPKNTLLLASTSSLLVPTPRGTSEVNTVDPSSFTDTQLPTSTSSSTISGEVEHSTSTNSLLIVTGTSTVPPDEKNSTYENGSYIVVMNIRIPQRFLRKPNISDWAALDFTRSRVSGRIADLLSCEIVPGVDGTVTGNNLNSCDRKRLP